MAVAALVLGIIGTILCWFPAVLLGVPLALVGLILGILARKNASETQQPTGMATAGLVMSIVGLTLGVLLSAMCFACVNKAKHDMERMATDPQFQQQNKEFNDAFKKALEESQKQQQQQQPSPQGSQQAITITARELYRAYSDNEVAADQRFKGQHLLVTGVVSSIDKDFTGNVVLHLRGDGSDFNHVMATLDSSAAGQAGRLHKNDQVSLRCEGGTRIVGSPTLSDCRFQ